MVLTWLIWVERTFIVVGFVQLLVQSVALFVSCWHVSRILARWSHHSKHFKREYREIETLSGKLVPRDPLCAVCVEGIRQWAKYKESGYSVAIDRIDQTYRAIELRWTREIRWYLSFMNTLTATLPYAGLLAILGAVQYYPALAMPLAVCTVFETYCATAFTERISHALEEWKDEIRDFAHRLTSDLMER